MDLLKECLRNVEVIFSAVAQNSNEPGCSIAQRTAHAIVTALEALQKEEGSSFWCPMLVVLSSASLNPRFKQRSPRIVQWVLARGCYYVYDDLAKAIEYLKEQTWIPLITAEPPGLVQDISRGYELSQDTVSPLVSYDDLARAMVQMTEESGGRSWAGKAVGVKATGNVKKDVLPLIKYQAKGLLVYFFPSSYGRIG